jgi:transposase
MSSGRDEMLANVEEEEKTKGRPSLFKEEYAEQLIEFFNIEPFEHVPGFDKAGNEKLEMVPAKFPTLARFATKIGVCRDTLYEWSTAKDAEGKLKHAEFSYAYKKAKDYQEAILVEGTMAGAFQPSFAIFTAKNVLGWRDKTEQEITGADGSPLLAGIKVSFVEADDSKSE